MEQSKLVEKLNKDVEDFISQLPRKPYQDGWPEDRWEEEMEKHPLFMSKPVVEGEDLPPLVEALQQLKYDPDENSPEELAFSHKEDGNHQFKCKKFRWAIECYTKGIEANCSNNILNAQLYSNRATAQFNIGNFRKALRDAAEAKRLKPDHLKAIQRGSICCWHLHEYTECISWCNEGLELEPRDANLLVLQKKAETQKKVADRNRRKAIVQESKKKIEFETLRKAIEERGITLDKGNLYQCENQPMHPALANARVHLYEDKLVWPVIFMYPEYGTTDYIQDFHEDSSFMDHLSIMFDQKNYADWDKNREYISHNLRVYFNDNECIVPFDRSKTLKQVLAHKKYVVHGGTPCFMVTVLNSKFDRAFRKRNTVVK